MLKNVLVSIIIPNYNSTEYIEETIKSVQNQSFKNWEIILVDDGSIDDSLEKIANIINVDSRVHCFVRPNDLSKGASQCRNVGLKRAKGEYIVFLDSDDVLAPWCLDERVKIINETILDFVVFPTIRCYDKMGDDNTLINERIKKELDLESFIKMDFPWHTTSPIWKKKFLKKIRGFDPKALNMQDWEIHIRALLNNPKYKKIDCLPDSFYRKHNSNNRISNSISDNILLSRKRLIIKLYSLIKSSSINSLKYTNLLLEVYVNQYLKLKITSSQISKDDLDVISSVFNRYLGFRLTIFLQLAHLFKNKENILLKISRKFLRYKIIQERKNWKGTFGKIELGKKKMTSLKEKIIQYE